MIAINLQLLIDDISEWLGSGSINIFGLPFSGKDTHGHELAAFFEAPLIGGGDILRSDIGPSHIKKHIASGRLAPSQEYLDIVLPFLSQEKFDGKPLILSAVGRWHGEEESIMEAAKQSGHPIKAVLHLDITKAEAVKRWHVAERNREDDADEAIVERRFREFKAKTIPVIDFYRSHGLIVDVDGMPPQAVVTEDIIRKLHALTTKN